MIVTGTVDGFSALINQSKFKYAIWPEGYLPIEVNGEGIVALRHPTTGVIGKLVWEDILPHHKVKIAVAWN